MLKITSWNINGIRAAERKGFLEYMQAESPDVLCLQETKAQVEQLPKSLIDVDGYSSHFVSGEKKGYSGVAIYTKKEPLSVTVGCGVPKFDVEGRVVRADYDEFTLYNIYYPNGGRGPERVQYKLEFYEMILDQWQSLREEGKRLILTGDFNTAHKEIDLARPDENSNTTGFLPIERAWLDKIEALGYVDTFRAFNRDPDWYTYWDQITKARDRNVGWRIDYFWVTPDVMPFVVDSPIKMEQMGSDHCPIELHLELP
jgi:exodeoxyribonuclease III